MNLFGIIYLATNIHNGEQYVGQTCQKLKRRLTNHKASIGKIKTKFSLAMSQYGFNAFKFEEIFIAFDEKSLHEAEKLIINDLNPVYNMTKGGSGVKGLKQSIESVNKRSVAMKKLLQSSEMKSKWAKVQLGRKHPKEEVLRTAKAKWRPVYCKELETSFLNQKFAADYFNTGTPNISQLIKNKGKVKNIYTLVRVI